MINDIKKTAIVMGCMVTSMLGSTCIAEDFKHINNNEVAYIVEGQNRNINIKGNVILLECNNVPHQDNFLLNHNVNYGGVDMISCTNGKLYHNLVKLNNIKTLEKDWNGYGAESFDSGLIQKCKDIISELPNDLQPKIFPTGRKSINMQYELSDESYLEFEVFNDKITFLRIPQLEYSKAVEGVINNDNQIKEMVKDFHGRQNC